MRSFEFPNDACNVAQWANLHNRLKGWTPSNKLSEPLINLISWLDRLCKALIKLEQFIDVPFSKFTRPIKTPFRELSLAEI